MQDGNAKQQVVEKIKAASSILVTVSRNPSVDGLAAALGLTLLLNKADKHATAVVSGQIPPAIDFLEPGKTFESSVSSLRDFIIALDKEKADRLRYKVEDDVVRIFITPYKTTITEKDLQFSQGDFNVDLIIALGVERKDDLDIAITTHGRILHDAVVVTINASGGTSDLGSIDWSDSGASSLCEMLVGLGESLQPNLLDPQIATALLTGIVAATDRFAATNTKPRVMTMAAQLMAAGANQQLIAAKLEEGGFQPSSPVAAKPPKGAAPVSARPADAPPADGEMQIEHPLEPAAVPPIAVKISSAEDELAAALPVATVATPTVADLKKDLEAASQQVDEAAAAPIQKGAAPLGGAQNPSPSSLPGHNPPDGGSAGHQDEEAYPKVRQASSEDVMAASRGAGGRETSLVTGSKSTDWRGPTDEPVLGGTLNATTGDAEQARREEEKSNRNRMILSHDAPRLPEPASSGKPSWDSPMDMAADGQADLPASMRYEEAPLPELPVAPAAMLPTEPSVADSPASGSMAPADKPPTLAEIEAQARAHTDQAQPSSVNAIDSARAAVDAALGQSAIATQPIVTPLTLPPVDQLMAPPPPLPDFSSLPPLPPPLDEPLPPVDSLPPQTDLPQPNQFKIPGQ